MSAVRRHDKWHARYHRLLGETRRGWARSGPLHDLCKWLDRGREDAYRRRRT